MLSTIALKVLARRRVSRPPLGTARAAGSPDWKSAAARDSAITGLEVNQVAAASNVTMASSAPIPSHVAGNPGSRAAMAKTGRIATSEAPSAHTKKLSHGLTRTTSTRGSEAKFSFTMSAAGGAGRSGSFLSSNVTFLRPFPSCVGELGGELALPDGR